jgi:hypothetical protein
MAFVGAKIILRNASLFHVDLVVARSNILFGEEASTMEFIKEIIND